MDGIRKCIAPLSDILHDLGTNFEDDLENVYDDELLHNMGIDTSYPQDDLDYLEDGPADW